MPKLEQYRQLHNQFLILLKEPLPMHVHMANLCALLKKTFGFFWVGFYMHQHEQRLTIGPYQGELPCLFIPFGKGVCGSAALSGSTIIVPVVDQYPGYIACHPEPKSEIVVPAMWQGECAFVLDIDHIDAGYFDDVDARMLEGLCDVLLGKLTEVAD